MTNNTVVLTIFLSCFFTACGGSSGDPSPGPEVMVNPTAEEIAAQEQLVRELDWVYDKMKSEYLWYKETPDVDAQLYTSAADLLDAMKVHSKDRFSYIIDAQQNTNNQNAVSTSFGFRALTSVHPFQVVRVYTGSSAEEAGLERADYITRIGDVDIVDEASAAAGWNLVRASLTEEGNTLDFSFQREGGDTWIATLDSRVVSRQTVDYASSWLDANGDGLGYISIYEWRSKTEDELRSAFDYYKDKNIRSLIIDLRDNQGGSIRSVKVLGSLILGEVPQSSPFIDFRFSDLGEVIFENEGFTTGYTITEESNALTTIERVHIISSGKTCSASEILINSLKPYVDVHLTGTTTCGKPYGFYGRKFEDKSVLWAINFQSDNAHGEGGWVNGIEPTCKQGVYEIYPYGDRRDRHLDSAIEHLATGLCQPQNASYRQRSLSVPDRNSRRPSYVPRYQTDPTVDWM